MGPLNESRCFCFSAERFKEQTKTSELTLKCVCACVSVRVGGVSQSTRLLCLLCEHIQQLHNTPLGAGLAHCKFVHASSSPTRPCGLFSFLIIVFHYIFFLPTETLQRLDTLFQLLKLKKNLQTRLSLNSRRSIRLKINYNADSSQPGTFRIVELINRQIKRATLKAGDACAGFEQARGFGEL